VKSCHTPPDRFLPLPFAWPGALSSMKVYSGWPLKVAWVEPSALVIVPSAPVTPGPAVTGPFTGGQNLAHWPLHLEVVVVSGTNQYSVKPLESVSTVVLPIFAVFKTFADDAADEWEPPPEVPVPPLEVLELPHPVAISAAAARLTGTSHLLPIATLRSLPGSSDIGDHVTRRRTVQRRT